MELEIRKTADPTSGGLIMQRNKVHHVYTVGRVARDLGFSEALIQDLILGLEPEDGVVWVYGANDDDGILAFTDEGIEEVNSSSKDIIASPHRTLDPSTVVLRCSWPPDTHVCGLHRIAYYGCDSCPELPALEVPPVASGDDLRHRKACRSSRRA